MDEDLDLITMESEDGSELTLRVERYFYYNGEEFVILTTDLTGKGGEDADRFVMRVTPVEGEEDMEEFTPIDDEALEDKLNRAAETVLDGAGDED